MPRELGVPRYLKKDTPAGTKMVHQGEFAGEFAGSYNGQPTKEYHFLEIEDGQKVILSGGSLRWRYEKDRSLLVGGIYDITYDGKSKIEKGQWAGSDAKNYSLAVYDPKECVALREEFGTKLVGATAVAAAPVPVVEEKADDSTEALDNLE